MASRADQDGLELKSLLQSYPISNVDEEVLDYQLAALRTEFIRPSLYWIVGIFAMARAYF